MSMSIGTSTPPTVRDTHAAWLRRREDSVSFGWEAITGGADRDRKIAISRREPILMMSSAL